MVHCADVGVFSAAADRSDLDTFANAAGGAPHQDGPARGRARFFLRQALAPKQVPNRDVADLSTAPGEGGSKSTLGHLWFGRDPLEHSVPDVHQCPASAPWARLRRCLSRGSAATTSRPWLCPPECLGHPSAALTGPHRSNHAHAQIKQISSCHACWPPLPACSVNHVHAPLGNLTIQFEMNGL